MRVEVKEILPEFIVIFSHLNKLDILKFNGIQKKRDSVYTLDAKANQDLWSCWLHFSAQNLSVDDYFQINLLVAWKGKYQRNFVVQNRAKLKAWRKEIVQNFGTKPGTRFGATRYCHNRF